MSARRLPCRVKPRRRLGYVPFVVALLAAACSAPQPIAQPAEAIVYVIGRDWHTDIGLPVNEIAGPLSMLEKDFPGVRFLTFGFGERQFLMNRETNVGAMLNALLPSKSAMLMTALGATPQAAFGRDNVVVLHVSRTTLERVEARIWQELELSSAGQPLVLGDGPYPGSVFYAARSTYSALYTCNTWSADIMRSAGLPMPAFGVLFAGQVMGMARWMGARHAADPEN